ncbi:MAG TPA: hypothetical protein VMR25_26565 [Planctomycetaceae bacterium]|jgi:hypothetical protein|nr:hypothetical protein [Planctomycetaceae bacterium]
MDDKPDGKRSRWRLWTGIVVFPLLVLYVFCIGPAFRVIGARALRSIVYRPLVEIARLQAPGDLEAWYLTAWSRDRFVKRSPDTTPSVK